MRALALAALLLAAPAAASSWAVVPGQSSISFTPKWNGADVAGRFPRFTASIRFDPARLQDARVDAVVDLAAATTSDRTVNGSLPGADWLDVKGSASARFQAASFRQTGPGRYVAQGTLTLRGATVPVTLPFTLNIKGNTAVMEGQTSFDRRAFRIGMDSDATGAWVAFAVPVRVRITATRQP